MSGDFENAGVGPGPGPKQGVYKELRQNPYLLGLSAVSRCIFELAGTKFNIFSLLLSVVSCLGTTKA